MLMQYLNSGVVEAGCDEAGRGCLAGPVYAAAVILPPNYKNDLLNDSKQLSEHQRDALRPIIERDALAWCVGVVSPEEIDHINILKASFLAMHRAIKGLKIEEPVSGKCIEIKMDMLSGSRVHVDTREGRKSVTLYQTAENIPLDITSAVVYGSEFFPLQRGMNRVYFYDWDGVSVSAEIRCCALYGGI